GKLTVNLVSSPSPSAPRIVPTPNLACRTFDPIRQREPAEERAPEPAAAPRFPRLSRNRSMLETELTALSQFVRGFQLKPAEMKGSRSSPGISRRKREDFVSS